MIQDAIFIPSDTGHAKADRPQKNEAKTRKNQRLKLNKKCDNLHFDINFIALIDMDYELIMSFKTITT